MKESFYGQEEKLEKIRKRIKGVENRRVGSEVFDQSTLLTLYDLANRGNIWVLNGVVKTGKEANVFHGEDKDGNSIAIKIHRVTTRDYNAMLKYIDGDRRFTNFRRNKREIINTWVRKEYKNLQRAIACNVRVPVPVAFKNNVILMEFIGESNVSAVMLKDYVMKDPTVMFNTIKRYVKNLYCSGNLVHADLSEYNILIWNDAPVVIDFSQAVIREHPRSEEFLKRDITNLVRFFSKYIELEEEKVLKSIKVC
jgi:RIO kinase 1|tara:strand:- start:128 stop:886 length:759 start_codon:yes stop_codon:yes gene_type:complete